MNTVEMRDYDVSPSAAASSARLGYGETAWDLIQENGYLEGTPAYSALNDLGFQ